MVQKMELGIILNHSFSRRMYPCLPISPSDLPPSSAATTRAILVMLCLETVSRDAFSARGSLY